MRSAPGKLFWAILTSLAAAALLSACLPSTTPTPAPYDATATPSASAGPASTLAPTSPSGTTSAPTATPLPTPVPEEHLGLVRSGGVTGSGATARLTIDYVELYTGDLAVTRGAEDGVTVDGAFYLRNLNPRLHTFDIAPTCSIRLLDPAGGAEASVVTDVAGLAAFLSTQAVELGVLFEIVASGTTVTRILQFHTP